MNQKEKAIHFAGLHVKGSPLRLYNAWDAGSAKAIVEAGARAIATSSWAVAKSQGYDDGEAIPLEFVEQIVKRIIATVDLPVSADFEGGYSENADGLRHNLSRLLDLGVIGINFEDRVVKGAGLYPISEQAQRIRVLREEADRKGIPLFINARTDVFLGRGGANPIEEVLERGKAYAAAGASGFFVPGLKDETQIARVCAAVELPVNILILDGVPSPARLAELGVSRISYGSRPYVTTLAAVQEAAWHALS
jgi:2-methylisocitrate lyase-like PEP mutase family enzyme